MNRTILIVDDEPHLRTLIQQTLEELEDEGVELLMAAGKPSCRAASKVRSRRPASGRAPGHRPA